MEYNGVSMIDGNCKKSPINIMLIFPNGKRLNFSFCNFECIVASRVQHAIDS
jgi:predicted ester cyclase